MKKIAYILTASLFLLLTGFTKTTVAVGDTNGELGSFIIERSSQPLIYNATLLRTYDIRYENSDMKIRVGIDESQRKCKTYLVVSDDFAIQYSCTKGVFGAKIVEEKYISDGIPSTDQRLNRIEYFRQKVITQIPNDEVEHIKLISVFFPKLINEEPIYAYK